AAVWGLPTRWYSASSAMRSAGVACVFATLLALSLATQRQISVWNDSGTLFEHALAVTQENSIAHTNLAVELAHRGKTAAARDHYLEALRIKPYNSVARNGLGVLMSNDGDAAAAVAQYQLALAANPEYAIAHRNLASQ